MRRFYVIVFLLIAAAACIGLAIAEDAGYVLIAYKNFRYESSVWATLALLAVVWLLVWGVKLLLDLAEMGLPTATEALDPISPQHLITRLDIFRFKTAIGSRHDHNRVLAVGIDRYQRQRAVAQQVAGTGQAAGQQVLMGRDAKAFAEHARKVVWR